MLTDVEVSFRALFAVSPLPMWIYDRTTLQFIEVNDAAVQRTATSATSSGHDD